MINLEWGKFDKVKYYNDLLLKTDLPEKDNQHKGIEQMMQFKDMASNITQFTQKNVRELCNIFYSNKYNVLPIITSLWDVFPDIIKQNCIKEKLWSSNLITDICEICNDSNIITSMNCNKKHQLCIECFVKVKKCPYCRTKIIYI